MTETPLDTRQRAKRDNLFLSAVVRTKQGDDATVRVRNLAPGGMMADGPLALAQGTTVTVELRGIGTVGGHIVWATAGRAGIAFDTEVDPRMARAPVVTPVERIVYGKPSATRRPGLRIR